MARQFTKVPIAFDRILHQTQVVEVAVDERLSDAVAQQMARELAEARLKKTAWETTNEQVTCASGNSGSSA